MENHREPVLDGGDREACYWLIVMLRSPACTRVFFNELQSSPGRSGGCVRLMIFYGHSVARSDISRPRSAPLLRAHNSAVECHLHTVEVVGSNPAVPTIIFNNLQRNFFGRADFGTADIDAWGHCCLIASTTCWGLGYHVVQGVSRCRAWVMSCTVRGGSTWRGERCCADRIFV